MTRILAGARRTSRAVRLSVSAVATVAVTLLVPVSAGPASANPIGSTHVLPWKGLAGVTQLCGPSSGYDCTGAGYAGQAEGWPGVRYSAAASRNAWGRHNCTLYAAYRLWRNGLTGDPGWGGNAFEWDTKAPVGQVDQTPAVGSIAQWNGGKGGHVAYVEVVTSDYIEVTDDNYGLNTTDRFRITRSSPSFPDNFIHAKDVVVAPQPVTNPVAKYAGHLVQWSGDTKSQKTAWVVTPDLKRLWVPDGGTWNCLKGRGVPGPDVLAASVLNQLPDQSNMWAQCGDVLPVQRVLRRNMSIRSGDGRYLFILQGDGNLVLYGPSGRALWANNRSSDYLIMQGDGNLVTYLDGGRPTWATNTGVGGAWLVVQNDGNLVVYAGGRARWASNTAGRV